MAENFWWQIICYLCVRFCITEGETGMYYVDNVMHSNNNSIVAWQDKL